MKEAWACNNNTVGPYKGLYTLFRNTTSYLQAWGHRKVSNVKLQIAVVNTVIFRLDMALESCSLTELQRWLRHTLKHMVLGLASLECAIDR